MSTEFHVGADDRRTRKHLLAALRKAGARRVGKWWGLGGSQEITAWTFDVAGGRLVVEAETYIGLTLTGDQAAISAVTRHL